jgi:diguanylate cyclase (GGDEF)-like protein
LKKLWDKKEYLAIGIGIILFLSVSVLSFVSIKQLQGNARIVNFDGIVRGATQKLIKMELQNAYSGGVDVAARDALRNRLDSILYALNTGKGETEETKTLIVLADETHSNLILALLDKWDTLKNEIDSVRSGADTSALYTMSEEYFKLANDTVFAAEAFSESQVENTTTILIVVNGVFVLFIIVAGAIIIAGVAVRHRADLLGTIAYVDPLTQLNNRASCERVIERLKEDSPPEPIAVLMFDMNNLKLANDFLGHQGGDKIITHFAKILGEEAKDYGFVGRYGGDEFLGIFEKSDEAKANEYIARVNEQVNAYNSLQVNDIEKISFAAGATSDTLKNFGIDDMIYEADRNMYSNKRDMKKRA